MVKPLKNWQPKTEVIRFRLSDALQIYKEYREIFSKEQPLPELEELQKHNLDILDGCLGSIRQQFGNGQFFYKPGIETAAAYFYFINKSHWLPNGNKRSAMMISLYYFKQHNKWLQLNWNDLYLLAMEVANYRGDPKIMLKKIKKIFQKELIDYKEAALEVLLGSWNF